MMGVYTYNMEVVPGEVRKSSFDFFINVDLFSGLSKPRPQLFQLLKLLFAPLCVSQQFLPKGFLNPIYSVKTTFSIHFFPLLHTTHCHHHVYPQIHTKWHKPH